MSEYLVQGASLAEVADAIREKSGTMDKMEFPGGFVSAVHSIQTGGSVEDSELPKLLNRTITEFNHGELVEIADYLLYGCKGLKNVNIPNVKKIGFSAFNGCPITVLNIDNVETIKQNAFYHVYSTNFADIILPKLVSMDESAFYGCMPKTIDLPKLTIVPRSAFQGSNSNERTETLNIPSATSIGPYAFYRFNKIKKIDLPVIKTIGSYAFYFAASLVAVIIRNTDSVCSMSNKNAFDACYHFTGQMNATYNPDGLADGYFYVPSELVGSYKTATNWSIYANQIRALEDYTVDGTVIGELDESKI